MSKETIDIADLVPMTRQEHAVVFALAFSGNGMAGVTLSALFARSAAKGPAKDFENVCERLVKRHFPIAIGMKNRRRSFRWTGTLTVKAARELVRFADETALWPDAEAWAKAEIAGDASYWSPPPDLRLGATWVSVLELTRLALVEEVSGFSKTLLDHYGHQPLAIARAAAYRLMKLLAEPPPMTAVRGGAFLSVFFQCCLNMAFMTGWDVRPMLQIVADHLSKTGTVDAHLRYLYPALCFWTGWREGLERPSLKAGEKAFRQACQALLSKGSDASVDKVMRHVWEEHRYEMTDQDADNFPLRLLMAMVCMAVKPGKTRPAQMIKGFWGGKQPNERTGLAYRYREFVREHCYLWGDNWSAVIAGRGSVLRNLSPEHLCSPMLALLGAWDYHLMAVGRMAVSDKTDAIMRHVPVLLERGYVNLAGLFLALTAGGYEASAWASAHAAVEQGGVWLLPCVAPESEWKAVLKILSEAVDKTVKSSSAANDLTKRALSWCVDLANDSSTGLVSVTDVTPMIREKGSDGRDRAKFVELSDLLAPHYAALVTPQDRLLAKYLQANEEYFYNTVIDRDVVEQLCGMTNLTLETQQRPDAYAKVVFEKRACSFESTVREDGGLTLGVPTWLARCRSDFVVRKLTDDRYAYVPIPLEVRKLATVFDQYGMKGTIDIPAAGMAEAEAVVRELSNVVPLANPEAELETDLPRVAGACQCVARLDFTEGVLTVRVALRPLPANPAFVVEPGVGLAEKLVSGASGAYWLVRDLAAERSAFAGVQTALKAAEDWYDGRTTWTVSDIAAAIESLSALKALGDAVTLEWTDERRLAVTAAPAHGARLQSSRTADEWFSVKGSFALDDGRVLSVMDLLAAMSSQGGRYVRLSDGDYVALTKSMAREMAALAAVARRKGGELEVSRAALPMLDKAFDAGEDALPLPEAMAASAAEIRQILKKKPDVPRALQATLRPYQTEGYRWLSRLAACGFGMCLADDMGLGKTVQVIALLLERIQDGASLVVAPSSVCGNWRHEMHRFAPTLNPILAFECPDDRLETLKGGDVVIVSYGYLLFHTEAYGRIAWNGIVLDEAQAIKNDASKRAHMVKSMRARFRVAATGTPVENHLGELWSLFDFLNPGLLGAASSFAARFTQDGKAVPALKKIVKPLILRRLKGDVLDDLPEKTEVTVPVLLGKAERSAYEGCRLKALSNLQELPDDQNRISILAELTRLRRFCCHPSLVLGAESDVPSAKMEALVDLLEGLHQGQHKALVFSQFTDYLALVRRMVESHGWSYRYLDGATPTHERERLVNEFQTGAAEFFLISLKAGGTGLNLTAANYVILLDPWWNPAVENQAADRAHRIGQTQPVTIYRLVASDTVEERVIELHKEKQAMANDLLEGTAKTSFTAADLIRLFK